MLSSACTAGSASTESGTSAMSGPTASGRADLAQRVDRGELEPQLALHQPSRAGTASRVRSWPTASMALWATLGSA